MQKSLSILLIMSALVCMVAAYPQTKDNLPPCGPPPNGPRPSGPPPSGPPPSGARGGPCRPGPPPATTAAPSGR